MLWKLRDIFVSKWVFQNFYSMWVFLLKFEAIVVTKTLHMISLKFEKYKSKYSPSVARCCFIIFLCGMYEQFNSHLVFLRFNSM